jgi:hypothetical protein
MTTLDVSGNVSFVSNQALAGYGGVAFVQWGALLKVSGNVSFVGNIAEGGGAISNCWYGNTDLSGDVQFVDNEAAVAGALDVESGSTARVAGRVSFTGNRGIRVPSYLASFATISPDSPSAGGAVFVQGASLEFGGSVSFENNTADMGGAVFLNSDSDLTVSDSVSFRGGVAASGGGLYIQLARAWFGGEAVIEGNVAERGGGLFARFDSLTCDPFVPFFLRPVKSELMVV